MSLQFQHGQTGTIFTCFNPFFHLTLKDLSQMYQYSVHSGVGDIYHMESSQLFNTRPGVSLVSLQQTVTLLDS